MPKGKIALQTQNPEVKRILKTLERKGWTIQPKRRHILAFPPGAPKGSQAVQIPSSPSSYRWKWNLEAAIKRAERQIANGEKVKVR